jgi:hypothetical protein
MAGEDVTKKANEIPPPLPEDIAMVDKWFSSKKNVMMMTNKIKIIFNLYEYIGGPSFNSEKICYGLVCAHYCNNRLSAALFILP